MMRGGMICSETKYEGFLRISCLCSLQQIISGTATISIVEGACSIPMFSNHKKIEKQHPTKVLLFYLFDA